MQQRLCAANSGWYCAVDLEPHAWPEVNYLSDFTWADRPIRKWVYLNCHHGYVFFGSRGCVLFESPADAVLFQLTWG